MIRLTLSIAGTPFQVDHETAMIRSGILNPSLAQLLCRFRHTNTIVVADRGFPFWPQLETVDLSLTDDIPRVVDVLRAIVRECQIGQTWMAEEFQQPENAGAGERYRQILTDVPINFEPHELFKKRVPAAIGLIRTGDTTQFGNIILQSA